MTSRIEYYNRPLVAFDPENKNHRRWFAEFNEHRTWAKCPVRFIVTDDAGDLVTLIQRQLIQFYVKKEFGRNSS